MVPGGPGALQTAVCAGVQARNCGSVVGRFGVQTKLPGLPCGMVARAFGVNVAGGGGGKTGSRAPKAARKTVPQYPLRTGERCGRRPPKPKVEEVP